MKKISNYLEFNVILLSLSYFCQDHIVLHASYVTEYNFSRLFECFITYVWRAKKARSSQSFEIYLCRFLKNPASSAFLLNLPNETDFRHVTNPIPPLAICDKSRCFSVHWEHYMCFLLCHKNLKTVFLPCFQLFLFSRLKSEKYPQLYVKYWNCYTVLNFLYWYYAINRLQKKRTCLLITELVTNIGI